MASLPNGCLQAGGEKLDVTILMSDLRDFTRISATLDPEHVAAMLNDYYSVLGKIIFQHEGTIDKFIGDAILAVFSIPELNGAHAHKAVRASLVMQNAVAEINTRRRAGNLPCCELGIGVHSGEVLQCFIGTADRFDLTVIGDTVNKAARYCAGAAGGQIMLGPKTNSFVEGKLATESTMIVTKHEGEMEAWLVKAGLVQFSCGHPLTNEFSQSISLYDEAAA